MVTARSIKGTRRLHLRHLDYPGLHRDGWVKRGQKHGLRVCLNVFESLLFLFVGEMLILMSFVHHHQRSRIPLNKPTMSGSVCHMSFTATQDHIRSCKRENYLTSTQDGQLRPTVSNCILDASPNNQRAQGHHMWRHKRELYISLG